MSVVIAHEGFVGDGTAVTPTTFSVTGTAGNAMILCMAFFTKTRTLTTITDDASNTGWTVLTQASASTAGSAVMAWNPNLPGSITQVVLTTSLSSTRISMGWMDVSGLIGTIDGTPSSVNNTSTQSAPAISATTSNASNFIVACMGLSSSASLTSIDSPFTQETAITGNSGGNLIIPATATTSSTGTYTSTWHLASALVNSTAIAAFPIVTATLTPMQPKVIGRSVMRAALY